MWNPARAGTSPAIGGRRACLLFATALAGALAWTGGAGTAPPAGVPFPAVVLDIGSGPNWVALLRSAGVSARPGTLAEGFGHGAVVVPTGVRLSTAARHPAGSHIVRWEGGDDGLPALERLQGELKGESADASSLRIVYSADATAWSVLNRRPVALAVDGAPSALVAVPNPSGGYTVRLPRGTHDVKLSF